jgi:hypothetical protein
MGEKVGRALVAWSSGIVSDSGVKSREIEYRQGIGWYVVYKKEKKTVGRFYTKCLK